MVSPMNYVECVHEDGSTWIFTRESNGHWTPSYVPAKFTKSPLGPVPRLCLPEQATIQDAILLAFENGLQWPMAAKS